MYSHKYTQMRRSSKRYHPQHLKRKQATIAISDTLATLMPSFLACIVVSIIAIILNFNIQTTTRVYQPSKDIDKSQLYIYSQIQPIIEVSDLIGIHNSQYKDTISEITANRQTNNLPVLNSSNETSSTKSVLYKTENKIKSVEISTEVNNNVHTLESQIGNSTINILNVTLKKFDLPNKYYSGLDFSSFQPYMAYTMITDKSSDAYKVVNDSKCYTDEYGLRRFKISDSQFKVNGQDDYVIALGTFYKPKGVVGNRYLIVTSTGMYTATTGDEKADIHTDNMNMFSRHDEHAGLIEWIIDNNKLNKDIKQSGTVTFGGPDILKGEILHIYSID